MKYILLLFMTRKKNKHKFILQWNQMNWEWCKCVGHHHNHFLLAWDLNFTCTADITFSFLHWTQTPSSHCKQSPSEDWVNWLFLEHGLTAITQIQARHYPELSSQDMTLWLPQNIIVTVISFSYFHNDYCSSSLRW